MNADDVLRFWFGELADADFLQPRKLWFAGGAAADEAIRSAFGPAVAAALAGGFEAWCASPRGILALILLLDQFTRNIHRGTAQAFAGDARAQALAQAAIASGWDRNVAPTQRWFLYLPLEHAESRALQEQSVLLFEALVHDVGPTKAKEWGLDGALDYARRHAAVVARYGRFPHRNAVLGRPSTAEEAAFLAQPGSSF